MFAKYSVKKPFTVLVGVILVILLGFISFSKMTADLLPNINLPYVIVMTSFPGASPEKIETVVTKPLEQSLATTTNIKNVSSITNENVSIIILEFLDGTNMDSTLIDINNKINLTESFWKNENVGTPTILKLNPNMLPVMIAAVGSSNLPITELTYFVNDKILPELEKIDGVASITTTGNIKENIEIKLSQEKIDLINEKILKNIDEKLSKSENDLKNAKSEIIKGKSELKKQSTEQTQKLTNGLNAINSGENEIKKALDDLGNKEQQLLIIQTILQKSLEIINPKNEKEVLTNISKQFEELNNKTEARKFLNLKNDITKNIQIKLNETTNGLKEIRIAKTNLNSKLNELNKQKSTLKEAENTLKSELSKAENKLLSSESEINRALSELDSAKETAYKNASIDSVITQDMISNILTAENFSMPAGTIKHGDDSIIIKVGDEFKNLDELKNLTILSFEIESLENITLEDLADITIANNSEEVYANVNNKNSIILSFQKQSTTPTATVAESINKAFETLEEKYENINFTPLMDQGIYIKIVIKSVLNNLLYGAILAIIILFIFLKDIKPTIAVALSIPISLTFALTLMYFTGVSINIISLSGLALSVGMLVDNAIVVIENTYRLKNEGVPTKDAAIKGASSVTSALLASTITTICVFAPILFIEGITRDIFTDMALTIAYSLMASLIVAVSVIPAMTSKLFEKNTTKNSKFLNKIINLYETLLKNTLKHKKITLLITILLFAISVSLVSTMGTAFIPGMEDTQMSLTMNFDKNVSQKDANKTSNTLIERLLEIEDIETIGAMKENNQLMSISSNNNNSISMYIILKEKKNLSTDEIKNEILDKSKDLNCTININTSNMDLSALAGSGVQVLIKGNDLDKLQEIAIDISKIMENTEGMTKIDNGIGETSPETRIMIDKNKAMTYGLTIAQIYATISNQLTTTKDSTNITINNKQYPIIIVKKDNDILSKDELKDILFTGKKNEEEIEISLDEISTIIDSTTTKSISRESSSRTITVSSAIDSTHNIGIVSKEFEKNLKEYSVPEGYSIELDGENESIKKTFSDLSLMIILAITLIYLVMVAQFQSLKLPFIIMFTIPLAFTGGLFALAITGQELSIIAMIGFLILSGIIVNNGIVLIDYINQLIQKGIEKKDAIITAGKTRLRPIIMTALTTILGMSTMALGIGTGADMIQALGIVTIGGLIYATLLTLIVIPCIYDIIYKK